MLIITMIRKIQKPITIVQRTVFYRLCGCASGVLIAVIWNCSMSIRHSLLHFDKRVENFFTGSFSQILSRVLFP